MSSRHAARTDISDMGKAAEETEVQRAASRQLIQEGRLIRSKELERRRQEEDDDLDVPPKIGSNNASRYSSQRSSLENFPAAGSSSSRGNTDVREIRAQLTQMEEKFKGAMVANVQLDNEKQLLRYEVDLLKDKLEDLKDSNSALQKSFGEKKRDLAYQRMQVVELNHRLDYARKQIQARDSLLVEHNLVLLGSTDMDVVPPLPTGKSSEHETDNKHMIPVAGDRQTQNRLPNGVPHHKSGSPTMNGSLDATRGIPPMVLLSKSTADLLQALPETGLESQILRLFADRQELTVRIEKLESQLEAERKMPEVNSRYDSRVRLNGPNQADLKQDLINLRAQAQEYKYKLQEALQKNTALESDIVRLEGQTKRYKTIADSCEQQEAQLKQDRQKYRQELRETTNQLEDIKAENRSLQRKLDKFSRGSVAPSGLPSTLPRGSRDSSLHR